MFVCCQPFIDSISKFKSVLHLLFYSSMQCIFIFFSYFWQYFLNLIKAVQSKCSGQLNLMFCRLFYQPYWSLFRNFSRFYTFIYFSVTYISVACMSLKILNKTSDNTYFTWQKTFHTKYSNFIEVSTNNARYGIVSIVVINLTYKFQSISYVLFTFLFHAFPCSFLKTFHEKYFLYLMENIA